MVIIPEFFITLDSLIFFIKMIFLISFRYHDRRDFFFIFDNYEILSISKRKAKL